MLLSDTCQTAADILAGKHDEELEYITQAIAHRQKVTKAASGLRKNAIVKIKNLPNARELAGEYAIVNKVNKKTLSVTVVVSDAAEGRARAEWGSPKVIPAEYRISPGLVDVVTDYDAEVNDRIAATHENLAMWKQYED